MSVAKDIAGERFGRLTAVRLHERHAKGARWLCACECGGEKVVSIGNLTNGCVKSCGCLSRSLRGRQPLKELLVYDELSGVFTWKVDRPGVKAGDVAGVAKLPKPGYWYVRFDGRMQLAHRLAWIYTHGEIPAGMQIDHINGDKLDNRLSNLRVVTCSENHQNKRRANKNNKVGLLGVSQHKNRFVANLSGGGRHGAPAYIGSFATPEEAHAAYVEAKRVYHAGGTL